MCPCRSVAADARAASYTTLPSPHVVGLCELLTKRGHWGSSVGASHWGPRLATSLLGSGMSRGRGGVQFSSGPRGGGAGGDLTKTSQAKMQMEPLVYLPVTSEELLDCHHPKAHNFKEEWGGGTMQMGVCVWDTHCRKPNATARNLLHTCSLDWGCLNPPLHFWGKGFSKKVFDYFRPQNVFSGAGFPSNSSKVPVSGAQEPGPPPPPHFREALLTPVSWGTF